MREILKPTKKIRKIKNEDDNENGKWIMRLVDIIVMQDAKIAELTTELEATKKFKKGVTDNIKCGACAEIVFCGGSSGHEHTCELKELKNWQDRCYGAEIKNEQLKEQLEKIKAENYTDLLDQMDEAWGITGMVDMCEIHAFIESRFIHKPTTKLREELDSLKKQLAYDEHTKKKVQKAIEKLRE